MNPSRCVRIFCLSIVAVAVLSLCISYRSTPEFPVIKDDSDDLPRHITVLIDNVMLIDLVRISPGSLKMGRDTVFEDYMPFNFNEDHSADSQPSFRATITKGYYIGKNNISVRQFADFLNTTEKTEREKYVIFKHDNSLTGLESQFLQFENGDKVSIIANEHHLTDATVWGRAHEDMPVANVTWQGAVAFCEWLSRCSTLDFRLPTEAEWALAARGHANTYDYLYEWDTTKRVFPTRIPGPGPTTPDGIGGLATGYLGNWCSDYFDKFTPDAKKNPRGPTTQTKFGNSHVLRRPLLSIYNRYSGFAADNNGVYGFRVVLDEDSVRKYIEQPELLPNNVTILDNGAAAL